MKIMKRTNIMKTDDMMQTQNENYKNDLKRWEMVKHRGNH